MTVGPEPAATASRDPWRLRRRLRAVVIAPELVGWAALESAPGTLFRVTKGLPADTELVRVGYDQHRDVFVLTYRHPAFDVVEEGHMVPEAVVAVEQVRPAGDCPAGPQRMTPDHLKQMADAITGITATIVRGV